MAGNRKTPEELKEIAFKIFDGIDAALQESRQAMNTDLAKACGIASSHYFNPGQTYSYAKVLDMLVDKQIVDRDFNENGRCRYGFGGEMGSESAREKMMEMDWGEGKEGEGWRTDAVLPEPEEMAEPKVITDTKSRLMVIEAGGVKVTIKF